MPRRALTRQAIVLTCALLALGIGCVPAHGSALDDILGRGGHKSGSTTPKHTTTATSAAPATATTTASSTTPASTSPQGSVHTTAKTTPAPATPKIATTVPRGANTTPSGSPGSVLPGTGAVPGVKATTPGGLTPPATTTAPNAGVPPTSAAGLAARRTGQVRQSPKQSTSLSPAAIVAAALAVLLILICCVWGAARWYAYEPHWTLSLRHSLGEAGVRMSATWDEFSDWARLGH